VVSSAQVTVRCRTVTEPVRLGYFRERHRSWEQRLRTIHMSGGSLTIGVYAAVPADRGLVPETIQSFSGTASIHAYRHGPFGEYRRPVESLEVSNFALEFGGEYRTGCPQWSGALARDPPKKRTSILDTTRGRFGSPHSALGLREKKNRRHSGHRPAQNSGDHGR
jgi:hypothetical protein